ncbi:MAG: tRNA preQ1(34) S-adenosylmethionine ribosyltransferase-isomerase QueA [Parcubacteria group bacterium CG11_big_fil_rev_8_21_14_0_20_39_14]|nr:MAG: tRNA preQ1(34) S-adenosylmethionine ribosyltransferase-isomerase QueA [Parcubacteria group bacterium CG11_big_fil_rev_8_21_14_0_20_39_14]PIS35162.1 MAG: tRNA preQ1(34) S-adenosylmethionine ribosyltransferase-isomerase QueA [Parcubacteria group bacterium CG08_land_8_20_14_0_20_38_56]
MKLKDFDYQLPRNFIAQKPIRPRDSSKLMVVDTENRKISHHKFFEIGNFLKAADILVINDSRVFPARLSGKKETGGKVEVLLLKQLDSKRWQSLLKNYKIKEVSKKLFIGKSLEAIIEKNIEKNIWQIKFNQSGKKLKKTISLFGEAPTPLYIRRKSNLLEYQTVYAKYDGSAAAPTAGFHFTKNLIKKLKNKGIFFKTVTLHVGVGTFEPIRTENIKEHKIHPEMAKLSSKTAKILNKAKKEGQRIMAVGTTTTRLLESFADKNGILQPGEKEINLYIYPGYKFKIIDGLITNFHLPKSSLIVLVSAFLQFKNKKINGPKEIIKLYKQAAKLKYRFYSFGDAMLII